jgi:Enhancer of polycomb-like
MQVRPACTLCRIRKKGCDRGGPPCGQCISYMGDNRTPEERCVVPEGYSAQPRANGTTPKHRHRIQRLESELEISMRGTSNGLPVTPALTSARPVRSSRRVHTPGTARQRNDGGVYSLRPSHLRVVLPTDDGTKKFTPVRAGGLLDWYNDDGSPLGSRSHSPSLNGSGGMLSSDGMRRAATHHALPKSSETIQIWNAVNPAPQEELDAFETDALPCLDAPYAAEMQRHETRVRAQLELLPEAVFRKVQEETLLQEFHLPDQFIEYSRGDVDFLVGALATSRQLDVPGASPRINSTTGIPLADVEYDMDSEDEDFLKDVNSRRSSTGLQPVSKGL